MGCTGKVERGEVKDPDLSRTTARKNQAALGERRDDDAVCVRT